MTSLIGEVSFFCPDFRPYALAVVAIPIFQFGEKTLDDRAGGWFRCARFH